MADPIGQTCDLLHNIYGYTLIVSMGLWNARLLALVVSPLIPGVGRLGRTATINMTISTKMGLGFGTLLALVVTLAVVVLFNLSNMHRQFSFVVRHDAINANARNLLKLVVDMETGQRGFVITGKDEFLEPYEQALIDFEHLLEVEKTLVSDNPPQVKLLEEIEASVQEWQEEAAVPEIAMRRKIGEATVDARHLQEILSQGVGKRLMDEFMAVGHEIEVAFSGQGDWEGAFAVEIIEKCMADREDGQRGFLITGQEAFLDKYHAGEQKKLPENFARLRRIISDRGRNSELSKKTDRLEELVAEWSLKAAEPEIAARRTMDEHPESLQDVTAMLEEGTGKRILDRIRGQFAAFIGEEERLTATRFASASEASSTTTSTTLLLALVSVVFGGVMATKITRGITSPVRRLADAVKTVAKGDLDQEVQSEAKDEIGELSRSFNQMVDNLKRLGEDREQGEQQLRGAKEYTENIIASMLDMLLVVAQDGSIVTINEATCRLLGYDNEDLIARPVDTLFCKEEEEEEEEEEEDSVKLTIAQAKLPVKRRVLRRLETDGSVSGIEKTMRTRNGDGLPVLMSMSVMRDDDRTIRGIVCVAQDITNRKATEQKAALFARQLEQTNLELEGQREEAEAMNAELKALNASLESAELDASMATRAKSDFLANMSHEIRTPMTAILGYSENLREGGLSDAETRDAIDTIHHNGKYLLTIINDILDMSKIEAGKMEVEHIPCSPHAMIADVAALMKVRTDAKNIAFNTEWIGPIPETIQTDPTRLKQILINIIGNAVKFTEEGGVRLITRFVPGEQNSESENPNEPYLQFDVLDTGVGMTQEQAGTLFQAFSQADNTTTRRFGGTGLGLAISKKFAGMLGGDITLIESNPGGGTRFRTTIATGSLKGVEMVDQTTAARTPGPTRPSKTLQSVKPLDCRILLAEDGPDNQRLISFILRKAGADVTVAENGQIAVDEAMAALHRGKPFDVILMDMQMPVLDGYKATTELRDKDYKGPIIALTAHAMTEDREKCLNSGCDDFATKPIDRKKLVAMIEAHLLVAAV